MQILFASYRDFVIIFYTCPEADIGLHTDGIQALILCAVRKFGFYFLRSYMSPSTVSKINVVINL